DLHGIAETLGERVRQDRIRGAVALEDGETRACGEPRTPRLFGEQGAREQDEARERARAPERKIGREHRSLREAPENDPRVGSGVERVEHRSERLACWLEPIGLLAREVSQLA